MNQLWKNPPWWLTIVTLAAAFGLLMFAALGNQTLIRPGPTFDVLSAVHPGTAKPSGSLLVLTVNETSGFGLDVVTCWLDSSCAVAETDSSSTSETLSTQREQADAAAREVTATQPTQTYAVNLPGVVGPSAGLASALALTSARTGSVLVGPGRTVAVTGTITTDGSVGPVGQIPLKAAAAAQAGASIMIVPRGQGIDVTGSDMTVVEVDSLQGAVRWLCDNAAGHGPACTDASGK